jgi:hypothetical protein
MPDVEHRDTLLPVIDFVDDAVVPDAKTPALPPRQLLASWRTRGPCQSPDGISEAFEDFGGKPGELFFGRGAEQRENNSLALSFDFPNGLLERNRFIGRGLGPIVGPD